MVYHAAWLLDEDKPAQRQSMLVKLYAGQLLERVVARSVEVHGGPLPHFRLWQEGGAQVETSHAALLRAGLTKGLIEHT